MLTRSASPRSRVWPGRVSNHDLESLRLARPLRNGTPLASPKAGGGRKNRKVRFRGAAAPPRSARNVFRFGKKYCPCRMRQKSGGNRPAIGQNPVKRTFHMRDSPAEWHLLRGNPSKRAHLPGPAFEIPETLPLRRRTCRPRPLRSGGRPASSCSGSERYRRWSCRCSRSTVKPPRNGARRSPRPTLPGPIARKPWCCAGLSVRTARS